MKGVLSHEELVSVILPLLRKYGAQEALLFGWSMQKHTPGEEIPWKINRETGERLREYARIYTSTRSEEALAPRFGDTYWFYVHFR